MRKGKVTTPDSLTIPSRSENKSVKAMLRSLIPCANLNVFGAMEEAFSLFRLFHR